MRNILKLALFTSSLFFGCRNELDGIDIPITFKTVNTESNILKGYGINGYQFYSPNSDSLYIEFNNNRVTYAVNWALRLHNYTFKSKDLSFAVKIDDRNKSFALISSKQDNVEGIVSGKKVVNKQTGQELDVQWFTKLHFDYQEIIKMLEIIKEIEARKQFVNAIKLLDKKISDEIIIKKSALFTSKIMVGHPCSSGTATCVGEPKYDLTQSLACDLSKTETLGGPCSNQWCIGYCDFIGCDCICVFFDYYCWCTAKGRYCTGPSQVPE